MNKNLPHFAATLLLTLFSTLPVKAASPDNTSVTPNKTVSTAAIHGAKDVKSSASDTSVLERFRTDIGPHTPSTLTALFAAPETAINNTFDIIYHI